MTCTVLNQYYRPLLTPILVDYPDTYHINAAFIFWIKIQQKLPDYSLARSDLFKLNKLITDFSQIIRTLLDIT